MRRTLFGLVGLIVVLVPAGVMAAETIDNPQYKEWAQWREGASVTWKTESAVGGKVQVVMTQTQTLKKLTPEKAVIEITGITEAGGQTIKSPPMTFDIVAKAPKVNFDPNAFKGTPIDPKEAAQAPKYKETKGKESLTISGKKLDCEWHQFEFEGGMISKSWSCDQIPSRIVKSESRSKEGSMTMQLVEWKGTKQ